MQSASRSSTAHVEQSGPGPALVPARGRRVWSVASSALRDAPGFEVVRRWVATLNQGAIVPWDGGAVSLLPRTAGARAAVVIDFEEYVGARAVTQDMADPPCDLVLGTGALDPDELARMQRVADECPIVYAPNLTAAVTLLRRLAATLARVEVVDDERGERPSGTDLARPSERRRGIADEPGLRLAALRAGDGVSEHTVFVAVPADRASGARPPVARRAFAPKILDAATFVASAERGLCGLSRLHYR